MSQARNSGKTNRQIQTTGMARNTQKAWDGKCRLLEADFEYYTGDPLFTELYMPSKAECWSKNIGSQAKSVLLFLNISSYLKIIRPEPFCSPTDSRFFFGWRGFQVTQPQRFNFVLNWLFALPDGNPCKDGTIQNFFANRGKMKPSCSQWKQAFYGSGRLQSTVHDLPWELFQVTENPLENQPRFLFCFPDGLDTMLRSLGLPLDNDIPGPAVIPAAPYSPPPRGPIYSRSIEAPSGLNLREEAAAGCKRPWLVEGDDDGDAAAVMKSRRAWPAPGVAQQFDSDSPSEPWSPAELSSSSPPFSPLPTSPSFCSTPWPVGGGVVDDDEHFLLALLPPSPLGANANGPLLPWPEIPPTAEGGEPPSPSPHGGPEPLWCGSWACIVDPDGA